ncbi:oxidoreductase, short-chain dehydrogenase/reductase family [Aspergillus mulundensis]|uniref:Retinol dehydrogenase 14 n=1 Tax=Aspergillus mulundensis TaxID=1810919 RepID=A0A3D8S5D1_9EURO|nr:Retinol dehydrogenase 14 [Aspergillus mulundensis]RDW81502.1 Retinol dehydrogenase 14 [Aspergillus mulundensis]
MNFTRRSVPFNPSTDIPSLQGKVILVTGGNIGLGKQTVLEYAKHNPALIWLAARNPTKAQAAFDDIKSLLPKPCPTTIRLLELDLSSLESVKSAATTVLAESTRLDILMLNAGIMAVPPGLTSDGYEIQFGTNYLGHILLARLLTPLLERTASSSSSSSASDPPSNPRIILLSSYGHNFTPKPHGIVFSSLRTDGSDLGPYALYGQSKLALILWGKEAAKRYPTLTIASVHPGVVQTNLANGATGSPCWVQVLGKLAYHVLTGVEQGVRNQLWASVSADVKSGGYYVPVGIEGTESVLAKDEELAGELWAWTEGEIGRFLG